MGIFVRKTLLAALEIEGVKPTLGSVAPDIKSDNASLLGDLQRLHDELKDLIAESLPSFDDQSFDDQAFADQALDDQSFDPMANQITGHGQAEDEPEDDYDKPIPSPEEPIASSIKIKDPLDELLDERLKTRLEMYLEHQRKGKPKVPTTKREPQIEEPSQSIPDSETTSKKEEKKPPEPKSTLPRSIPPDPLPREDKTSFSDKSLPLSGNPPPKKPKY